MATYTTREAAGKLGMHQLSLQRLVSSGKIAAPPLRNVAGGSVVRIWSERDIERVRRYRAEHGRGRPSKRKK